MRMADSSLSPTDDNRLLWGWETFFEELRALIRTSERYHGNANQSRSEWILERLQSGITNVVSLKHHLLYYLDTHGTPAGTEELEVIRRYSTLFGELVIILWSISQQWENYIDEIQSQWSRNSYQVPLVISTSPGRPRFDISQEQLVYLHSLSFSWSQIAAILGVSRMTLYRRRAEFGMLGSPSQVIGDEQLHSMVREMHSFQPGLGEVMIWGRIRSQGFNVTRARLRHAIRSTDPLHTALRWRGNLSVRHPYSVPGPNSLWHIGT